MFEIGSSLRQARQHRGLELADVERETRIRAKYLDALEDERFDVLPGHAYVRGFMRTYAEFVGLDADMLVEEYNERFAPSEDELPPLPPRVGGGPRLRLSRPVAGVLLAVVAAAVVVWQLGFSGPRHAAKTTTTHAAIAPVARRPPAPTTTTAPVTTTHAPATLVIRATRGDCWVEVRLGSPTGDQIYEHVLQEGGTLRFGLKRKLWVRLGAPWNADVTVRGKRHAPFDSGGQPADLIAS